MDNEKQINDFFKQAINASPELKELLEGEVDEEVSIVAANAAIVKYYLDMMEAVTGKDRTDILKAMLNRHKDNADGFWDEIKDTVTLLRNMMEQMTQEQ